MRLVQQHRDDPTVLEVAWMWLPTFVGQNSEVLKSLDVALADEFPLPLELTDEKLDEMHNFVVDKVCEKFQVEGLSAYLQAVKNVRG